MYADGRGKNIGEGDGLECLSLKWGGKQVNLFRTFGSVLLLESGVGKVRGLFHKTLANCKLQLAVSTSLVISIEMRAKSLAVANPLARFHGNDQ
jgi:hypothetical protein